MLMYPYIWTLISAYESPMLIAVYIIIYRAFTGLFYSILVLSNGAEFRHYFGPKSGESSDKINNNSSISCNVNEIHGNVITKRVEITENLNQSSFINKINESKKFTLGPIEHKIIHIATIIFRSTYCIHIPVFIWYYSQHKWPVLTTGEWVSY